MIESEETLELLRLMRSGASASRLEKEMNQADLARIPAALGLPMEAVVHCLGIAAGSVPPGRNAELESVAVPYFQELVRSSTQMESFFRELDLREQSLRKSASDRTARYLPEGSELGSPRLVILPLGLDFRTDRDVVFMDPLAALQLGFDGTSITLAHELHHVGRWRLTGENLTLMSPSEPSASPDAPTMFRWWAKWLEAEGIADCVSNVTETDVPILRPAIERRRRQMSNHTALLSEALRGFQEDDALGGSPVRSHVPTQSDLLPLAHPVGFQIAKTIEASHGRSELIECVGAPERFLTLYDGQARQQGLTGIDPDVLRWLAPHSND